MAGVCPTASNPPRTRVFPLLVRSALSLRMPSEPSDALTLRRAVRTPRRRFSNLKRVVFWVTGGRRRRTGDRATAGHEPVLQRNNGTICVVMTTSMLADLSSRCECEFYSRPDCCRARFVVPLDGCWAAMGVGCKLSGAAGRRHEDGAKRSATCWVLSRRQPTASPPWRQQQQSHDGSATRWQYHGQRTNRRGSAWA